MEGVTVCLSFDYLDSRSSDYFTLGRFTLSPKEVQCRVCSGLDEPSNQHYTKFKVIKKQRVKTPFFCLFLIKN